MRALAKHDSKKPKTQRAGMCYSSWRSKKHSDETEGLLDTLLINNDDMEQSKQYLDSDFALVRDEERLLQIYKNGIVAPKLLLNSLLTVDDMEELSDEERAEARKLLFDVAEVFVMGVER